MQQHKLKKYVEFTVNGKPDKMNKKLRNLQTNRPEIFIKKNPIILQELSSIQPTTTTTKTDLYRQILS